MIGDDSEFRYDPDNNTLYMKKVYIVSQKDTIPLVLWEPDMTLDVKEGYSLGCNWLIAGQAKYALQISHRTKIKGDRNLIHNSDGILYVLGGTESAIGIDNQARVNLEDAALFAYGNNNGITGYYSNITMNIKGTSIIKAYGANLSFSGFARLTLNNHKVTEPEGAVYGTVYGYNGTSSLYCIHLNGEPVKDTVATISYYNPFDVNLDGNVDISDIVAVINTMAGDTTYKTTADVNNDKDVNIADVVAIINYMAGQ